MAPLATVVSLWVASVPPLTVMLPPVLTVIAFVTVSEPPAAIVRLAPLLIMMLETVPAALVMTACSSCWGS